MISPSRIPALEPLPMNRALIACPPLGSAPWAVDLGGEAESGQALHASLPDPMPLPGTTGSAVCS